MFVHVHVGAQLEVDSAAVAGSTGLPATGHRSLLPPRGPGGRATPSHLSLWHSTSMQGLEMCHQPLHGCSTPIIL